MPRPAFAVLVRFRTELDHDAIMRVMAERAPGFRALPGLEQKYYLRSAQTGDDESTEYGGLYLWESSQAIDDYRATELAATIESAYRTVGVADVSVFEVLSAVRPGPDEEVA